MDQTFDKTAVQPKEHDSMTDFCQIMHKLVYCYFSVACPPGFTHMPRVNGCYAVVRENLEWGIAGLRCKKLYPDAHLLILESSAEQTAVAALLSRYSGMNERYSSQFA